METQQSHENQGNQASENVATGLAFIGGLGVSMMMLAAGIGVVKPDIDNQLIGLLALLGAGVLIIGVVGWVLAARPHENFDDINVPTYHGHHHEEGDDAH